MRTDYEETENLKRHDVKDCPNEFKSINKLFSKNSETNGSLSSYSNFPERPSSYELEPDKPVLPEI